MRYLATYPWYCKKCKAKGDCYSTGEIPDGEECPKCHDKNTLEIGWAKGTTQKEKEVAFKRIAGI